MTIMTSDARTIERHATGGDDEVLHALTRDVARPIRRIVEIGVADGHDTAFFLRTFRPDHLILIDADPANHPLIARAVAGHTPPGCTPIVETVCAYVGRGCGETIFAGATVPHRRLNDLIRGPVDLIKIHVDGCEMRVLESGDEPIARHRPLVIVRTGADTAATLQAWFAARRYQAPDVVARGPYRHLIFRP